MTSEQEDGDHAIAQAKFVIAGEAVQNRHIPLNQIVGLLYNGQFASGGFGHKNFYRRRR
jgi:hypothetical protein